MIEMRHSDWNEKKKKKKNEKRKKKIPKMKKNEKKRKKILYKFLYKYPEHKTQSNPTVKQQKNHILLLQKKTINQSIRFQI